MKYVLSDWQILLPVSITCADGHSDKPDAQVIFVWFFDRAATKFKRQSCIFSDMQLKMGVDKSLILVYHQVTRLGTFLISFGNIIPLSKYEDITM